MSKTQYSYPDPPRECRHKTIRGRLVSGTATLDSNHDNQALLVVVLDGMKPGQKVVFTVEEDVT